MKADAATEAAVMAVFEEFARAYEARDVAGTVAAFAPDADLVFFGTGADERRIGLDEVRAQIERDLAQSQQVTWRWGWRSVSMSGSVAWIAVDASVHALLDGQELSMPLRVTAVLEARDGAWRIVQGHASFPAAGQEEGQSFPG